MTVLYSPLGLAYGTLYSAILLTRPQRVVVVTSPEAVKNLHAALDAAHFYHSRFTHETHVLDDALAGFDEARRLARELAREEASCHIINLTGGTTVLQECVRSVGYILRRAPDADTLVREVAVIDRRSAGEQARSSLSGGRIGGSFAVVNGFVSERICARWVCKGDSKNLLLIIAIASRKYLREAIELCASQV